MSVNAKEFLEARNGGPLTFGQILKSHRLGEHWSQQELADKVGVSKVMISLMERGMALPSPENLKRIANAFEMPVEAFLRYVLQDYAAKHGKFQVDVKAG